MDRLGIKDLVGQFLAFSRKQVLEYKLFDINALVADFKSLIRRTIWKDIAIRIINSDDTLPVMADITQLHQVNMNLCTNAADAMPHGGELKITTDELLLNVEADKSTFDLSSGKFVTLTVSDTGIGMDEQTVGKIFEPFFTTKGKEGTGLGLSTAYGIIKQHGGTIMVDSDPGKGTTFDIYLPAVD